MLKKAKKFVSILLCVTMFFSCIGPISASAASVDVGTNPTPKIDIAVNVPSDYPGTFLDFKQELTQKLIEQGLNPSDFRITDTAAKIDTTDLNGWYVYDHYLNNTEYNKLGLSAEQQKKQPYRAADNSNASGANPVYMKDLLANGNISGCRYFAQHIWSYADDEGKASMVFAGYGTQALLDYMIYPAASDSRRTISFDIDANAIGAHTLHGYGFLLNAGIDNTGKLVGYVLYIGPSHTGGIQKISLDAETALATAIPVGSTMNVGLTATKKARLTVELQKNAVTVQVQQYDAAGNLSAPQTKIDKYSLDDTGFNGFGPIVGYASHGCSELTVFRYLDLEMAYESSAFDALKNVQYYQGADYKYFVNLVGDSNDPQIPDEKDQSYADGINRMNENEIFYISNGQDGKIVTDTTTDEEGNVTHQGLGSENGYIASGDNYVELMAQYIYTNYIEKVKFQQAPIASDLPLANFYVVNADTGEQLMTVHQKHLLNTGEKIRVNIVDKSKPGTLAGADGRIAQWNYKIYDPDNNVKYDTGWIDDPAKIKDDEYDGKGKSGRYTFELSVRDQLGNESKVSQTYVVAFLDDEEPVISGENTRKNIVNITFTDTGMGIDEDGITFMEDGRGSGVAAYWITNSETAAPAETDWEILDAAVHSYSFEYPIDSTDPIVVWVKDECGNAGNKAVFKPKHVIVEDADGNPIDDYYVISDKPIIVLPEDEPESGDEDDKFSGWETDGGDPVTPGTEVDPSGGDTIVIRPGYSKGTAQIIYLANGGQIATAGGETKPSVYFNVTSGASIETKIDAQHVLPTRVGYSFKGWKLINGTTNDAVNGYVGKDVDGNLTGMTVGNAPFVDVATTVAKLVTQQDDKGNDVLDEDGQPIVILDKYYLVAQWEVGHQQICGSL